MCLHPTATSLRSIARPFPRPCAGRTPIPPPLRSKFLVIEQQREEEAAMGEQPLEQVLAQVPVPQVCVGGWGEAAPGAGSSSPEVHSSSGVLLYHYITLLHPS